MTGPPRRAALTRLALTDFRNYSHIDLALTGEPVVLWGANGAGKTNLLEAVSLLSPGRGLRRARLDDCACTHGEGGWAVASEVEGPLGTARLGTGRLAGEAATNGQRQCRLDGQMLSGPGRFTDHLRVAWLTPAQDRIFAGPATDRRRFLDALVASDHPQHGRPLAAFTQAMRERNRLLADHRPDPAWVSALEVQMAEAGVAVAAGRRAVIAKLQTRIDETVSAFPPAQTGLAGTLETHLDTAPAVEVEEAYRQRLRDERSRDAGAGRALEGPHRSDLLVTHGHTGVAAEQCSTGEQKALLISIVLAQARLIAGDFSGFTPVLLLDEIAAHLDAKRRNALFDELLALGAQAWLTGTDRSLFDGLEGHACFVNIEGGNLTKIEPAQSS
ncbi:MAG: DNA replication/repair protein RecF [Alphaproteobacteria bacterium]